MSHMQEVLRDERSEAVENKTYRWAYFFLSYALLIDVVYRGLLFNEAAWDLIALVIIVGGGCTAHQFGHRTLPEGWAKKSLILALISGVLGAAVAIYISKFTQVG